MKYPNLELLEYILKRHLSEQTAWRHSMRIKMISVFPQIWSNTGCGIVLPNCLYGQAFTEAYSVVFEVRQPIMDNTNTVKPDVIIYGVFFKDRLAYIISNPTEQFFEDLRNRQLVDTMHWRDRYEELH